MMIIGKPSRRQIVLIVMLALSFLFVAFVKLPLDFDSVYARDAFDFGADRAGKLTLSARGKTRHERLGLFRIISEPYRFKVCTRNATHQDLTLKKASLARVVGGQLMPVDAEFNIDGNWIVLVPGVDRICITDLLSLDIKVESDEFYCVDLTFDLREDEQVERKCLRFDHDISHHKVTLWELFIGFLIYSA